MDLRKESNINATRARVGWAYEDMRWLSSEEAGQANQARDELLAALSGWAEFDFGGAKPHHGPLSPGCRICGEGGWRCNFVNGLCTQKCFYCPQDRTMKDERPATTEGCVFESPEDHVRYLKIFKSRGVAFSGGEPLLALDRMLAHIGAIRRAFGDTVYLWAYTNGSVGGKRAFEALKEAGLDELRVNISASNYSLAPVEAARSIFSTVAVEIPAIPEDFDVVKELLKDMQRVGVSFLNLHQLGATRHNVRAMRARGYRFLHQSYIPVFESEMCALNLLLCAREQSIDLPVHYCSCAYRHRFQGLADRRRLASLLLRPFQELSEAGYIRAFLVRDRPEQIRAMVARLEEAHCPPEQWKADRTGAEIGIPSGLLSYIDWESASVTLQYIEPGIEYAKPALGFTAGNVRLANRTVYDRSGWTRTGLERWKSRFLEKNGSTSIELTQAETEQLDGASMWEEMESGLPEIY